MRKQEYWGVKIQQMQQYAGIYSLQNYSTCFGCHSTHHQEYQKLYPQPPVQVILLVPLLPSYVVWSELLQVSLYHICSILNAYYKRTIKNSYLKCRIFYLLPKGLYIHQISLKPEKVILLTDQLDAQILVL